MMNNFIIESLILLISAVILIRIAGKKSVAKMTSLETVIILAIGTTMGHAIKENSLWQVIIILCIFVLFLIFIQKLQLKHKLFERYLIGKATLVITEGKIIEDNLIKLRMTKEQLEMRLREKGISYITDIKNGTIESNGDFGFELADHAKPITKMMLLEILNKSQHENKNQSNHTESLFDQVLKDNK
ncbi:DUF421 domain-containing protein [Niallia endozanthoxylica]|uniref:DUF421 domain-containing protein n=1 Tax=Niallia endozanthoxylica TaxID=2036016 RepID=A0A5J5HBG6_9BACI|nr:YetF domain-containing protein [Niallia endozanthoxylica]KAA9018026.1 DUF421 domain-containing protein [Niallia endozanthoxylica]